MKKFVSRLLLFLLLLLVLAAAFLALWVSVLFPLFDPNRGPQTAEAKPGPVSIREIANEAEHLGYDEENGVAYVNNEIIILVKEIVTDAELAALEKDYEAELGGEMADIGVYRMVLKKARDYEDLEKLAKKLEKETFVEAAYLDLANAFALDAKGEKEKEKFETSDPVFPASDPWNGADWSLTFPDGDNWGMEAIRAPGAWGYLDRMETVRIGLIDSQVDTAHEDLVLPAGNSGVYFIDTGSGKEKLNTYRITPDEHGTHVSGIMAAGWDNEAGVSGVTGGKGELYYSAVYYDDNGNISSEYGTAYTYLLSLKRLIDQDVQVINISQNTGRLLSFAASRGNRNAVHCLTQQAELAGKLLNRIIEKRSADGKRDFVICMAAGNANNTYYYRDDTADWGYRTEMTAWEVIRYLFGWRGERGDVDARYNNFLNLISDAAVKERIIVVGSVGIDRKKSTNSQNCYCYSSFSDIGSRVDIAGPGEEIYSCVDGGYDSLSGTSMAAPHVSGVAGLVFACNPGLTGPEVKNILCASASGRFSYTGGQCGLVNAEAAAVTALQTVKRPVSLVLRGQTEDGLDLCFVVDTTGSMGDDIADARENMSAILEHLAEKTENYRVALVDYRDFESRTGRSEDYPSKLQLDFSGDQEEIIRAINDLTLGNGGDSDETVYSGLMCAAGLDWREFARKVVIVLGDAAPHDPEPVTGYTMDRVVEALKMADVSIDDQHSDRRVLGEIDDSLINVFTIGTDAGSDAVEAFREISDRTGGAYTGVEQASEVGDAIIDSIEQIDMAPLYAVKADFGDSLAGETIDLYQNNQYLFSFETDGSGRCELEDMESDSYRWKCHALGLSGTLSVEKDGAAETSLGGDYWFSPLQQYWRHNRRTVLLYAALAIAACAAVPAGLTWTVQKVRRKTDRKN